MAKWWREERGLETVGARNASRPQAVWAAALVGTVAWMTSGSFAFANDTPFATWLAEVKTEALQRGISQATVDQALNIPEPITRVLELDRSQPEFTLAFPDYLDKTVSPARIATARKLYKENHSLLKKIGAQYGVQPRFIVAFWGMESDFGRLTGGFNVPAALATLAYDGRRATFFRDELFNALKIIDEGNITAPAMTGSWAGAMGQTQFMPSSFHKFAVDADGDGKRDIWTDKKDVFGSIAHYLAESGWKDEETWGRAVKVPKDFDAGLISLDVKKTLNEWQALGVRKADGHGLPKKELSASLVRPGDENAPVFAVYDNYRTTLLWNRSTFFALAIGHLADSITPGKTD